MEQNKTEVAPIKLLEFMEVIHYFPIVYFTYNMDSIFYCSIIIPVIAIIFSWCPGMIPNCDIVNKQKNKLTWQSQCPLAVEQAKQTRCETMSFKIKIAEKHMH